MQKALGLILLSLVLTSPAAADEVIVGEMDLGSTLPFCGG
jgi:hypothetical protein